MAKQEPSVAQTDEQLEDSQKIDPEDSASVLPDYPTTVVNRGDEEIRINSVMAAAAEEYSVLGEPAAYRRPQLPKNLDAATKKKVERFAKLAKVSTDDVMAYNPLTNVGVTANGGKYQMNRKGTQIRVLAGPVPEGLLTEDELAKQAALEKAENAGA